MPSAVEDDDPTGKPAGPARTVTQLGVPSREPGAREVKAVVQAGADRRPDRSVTPLAGAAFDIYRVPAYNEPGGVYLGSCLTAADGRCGIIVSTVGWPSYNFRAVQTGAPTGWKTTEFDLIQSYGAYDHWWNGNGQTREVPRRFRESEPDGPLRPERWFPTTRDNPPLAPQCGLDVAMVVDLSNTATNTWEYDRNKPFGGYKTATSRFVDALAGTDSRVAVYTYGTSSPAVGPTSPDSARRANATLPLTSVRTVTGADTVRSKIHNLQQPGNTAYGQLSWDAALAHVAQDEAAEYDVVLLLTNLYSRTTYVGGGIYRPAAQYTVEEAIHSANAVKATGAKVVVVGVEVPNEFESPAAALQRVAQVSGPARGDDFHVTSWADLGPTLRSLGTDLAEVSESGCAGTLRIAKQVRDADGELRAGVGWPFRAEAGGVVGTATTDRSGVLSFTFGDDTGRGSTATVTETQQPDHELERQDGYHAMCMGPEDEHIPVENVTDGFVVDIQPGRTIDCTVINAFQTRPEVSITKTGDVDSADGAVPTVPSGTEVTWTYAVHNTGNVPLTDLHVVDDRGLTVSCPPTPGSSPEPAGNPIAVLDPRARITCVATGPVTALADP